MSSAFSEFNKDIKEFLAATNETILQIERPIMFNAPNILTGCSTEELAQEQSFVAEAEELTSQWTDMISDLLETTVQKVCSFKMISYIIETFYFLMFRN